MAAADPEAAEPEEDDRGADVMVHKIQAPNDAEMVARKRASAACQQSLLTEPSGR